MLASDSFLAIIELFQPVKGFSQVLKLTEGSQYWTLWTVLYSLLEDSKFTPKEYDFWDYLNSVLRW